MGRLNENVRQTDLANQLDVTPASLVRTLDQMVAADLVERHRDPADARVSRIRLTPGGRALITTIEMNFAALRRKMLDDVSNDDLATALRVAEHLSAKFMADRGRDDGRILAQRKRCFRANS